MARQIDVKALISHLVKGDGAEKCRICMGDTSTGQAYLGDTILVDGNEALSISQLLEVITGAQVDMSSLLPEAICLKCFDDLQNALPFIQMCKNSTKKWTQVADFITNHKVKKNIKNLYFVVGENDINTVTDSIKCPVLPPETPANVLKNFKLRIYRVEARKKRNLKEKLNRDTFLDNSVERFDDYDGDLPENDAMMCPQCYTIFDRQDKLNKHIQFLNMKSCPLCKEILYFSAFIDHLYDVHKIEGFSCEICSDVFTKAIGLETHRKLNHYKSSVCCPECKQSYLSELALAAHKHIHERQECKTCERKFSNKICFRKHYCFSKTASQQKCICDYCKAEYVNKSTLRLHIWNKHLNVKQFECVKCGKSFLSRSQLKEHDNTHDRVADRYVCQVCGGKYSTRRGIENHLKRHQDKIEGFKIPVKVKRIRTKRVKKLLKVKPIKTERVKKPVDINKHAKRDPNPYLHYECSYCNMRFTGKTTLHRHMKFTHGFDNMMNVKYRECIRDVPKTHRKRLGKSRMTREMKCPKCDTTCKKRHNFNHHLRNLRMKSCISCNKAFEFKDLMTHLQTQHHLSAFLCTICSEPFQMESSLQHHIKTCHSKGPYVCLHCYRSFRSNDNLSVHISVHTPRHCTGCGQSFSRLCYRRHTCMAKNSSKSSIYTCDYCMATYKSKLILKIHIQAKHLKTLHKYQCEKCGKKFKAQAYLTEHMNTHEKVHDRHVCHLCGAKYSTRRGIEVHLQRHQGITPKVKSRDRLECEYCNLVFFAKSSLSKHVNAQHLNKKVVGKKVLKVVKSPFSFNYF